MRDVTGRRKYKQRRSTWCYCRLYIGRNVISILAGVGATLADDKRDGIKELTVYVDDEGERREISILM